jgi:hypothetical protein
MMVRATATEGCLARTACEARMMHAQQRTIEYTEQLSDLNVEIKTAIDKIQDSFARIYAYSVIDILNGNNVNDVPKCERTVLLKCALDTIKAKVPDLDQCIILVEKQPPFGYNNTTVQDQIMMYFADYRIVEISASEKNKITLNDADNKIFKRANKNPRVANKKHSLYNTDRLTTLFNIKLLEGIKPALREHISDCFMQAVAYAHRVVNSKPS